MGHSYADSRYGVITRKWFGLTQKNGGDAAAGFTFGTGDPGPDVVKVTRFYPKAPCDIIKFGAMALATVAYSGGTVVDKILMRLKGRGASASNMASLNLLAASSTISAYSIASIEAADTTDFPITQVKAGEYLAVWAATKETDKGTDLGSTLAGTVAFFVDIVPKFDGDKWDGGQKSTYQK